MHLTAWFTNAKDAKMLLDIPSPINNVLNDQLALNLVNNCLDETLQILCMPCFAKIPKIGYTTIAKILNVQLQNSTSHPVFNEFQQSLPQNLSQGMFYPK